MSPCHDFDAVARALAAVVPSSIAELVLCYVLEDLETQLFWTWVKQETGNYLQKFRLCYLIVPRHQQLFQLGRAAVVQGVTKRMPQLSGKCSDTQYWNCQGIHIYVESTGFFSGQLHDTTPVAWLLGTLWTQKRIANLLNIKIQVTKNARSAWVVKTRRVRSAVWCADYPSLFSF